MSLDVPTMTETRAKPDPRVYMAAERTFLAWIRTGIALMAFGFVVARFGVFLRQVALGSRIVIRGHSGLSLYVGLGLISVGLVVCVVSALRHTRYVKALDAGRFREAYGATFAFAIVALLAVVGVTMAVVLASV
ncbi:MAG: DUF202 domain-containing protein [Myxococcales bacterium]|nr:DUF202 domain-containing protein [Myxococcales bacterium]